VVSLVHFVEEKREILLPHAGLRYGLRIEGGFFCFLGVVLKGFEVEGKLVRRIVGFEEEFLSVGTDL
jgi:hypothetical protein